MATINRKSTTDAPVPFGHIKKIDLVPTGKVDTDSRIMKRIFFTIVSRAGWILVGIAIGRFLEVYLR